MMIREYRPGDEDGIMALDRAVEEHPWNRRDLANWRWKYQGPNPAGEPVIFVAEHEGALAAHFAALPMRYQVCGQAVTGSHSIAMMVEPKWQNRGLIKFVADKVLARVAELGWAFTYGYPNRNAHDLHLKLLGYEDVAMQPMFLRELRAPVVRVASGGAVLDCRPVPSFGPDALALWQEASRYMAASVVRDAAFLNWRYLARPDVPYEAHGVYRDGELAAWCVLKLYREDAVVRGHFVDLFGRPEDLEALDACIVRGLDRLAELGASEATLWLQGSRPMQRLLGEHGFAVVSKRPLICRFHREAQAYRSALTPEGWYFTMGDTLEIY